MAYFIHCPARPREILMVMHFDEARWSTVRERIVDARVSPEVYCARAILRSEQALVDAAREIKAEVARIGEAIASPGIDSEALDAHKARLGVLDGQMQLIERIGTACRFRLNLAI